MPTSKAAGEKPAKLEDAIAGLNVRHVMPTRLIYFKYASGDYSPELLLQHLLLNMVWHEKLSAAVARCIDAQRCGMDVLASDAWDRVVEVWEDEERGV